MVPIINIGPITSLKHLSLNQKYNKPMSHIGTERISLTNTTDICISKLNGVLLANFFKVV